MILNTIKFSLLLLAAKYGLEVIQYNPGHVIVRIKHWHLIEPKLATITQIVENDPYIYAFHVDGNTIEVLYDEDAITKNDIVQKWFEHIRELGL